ncbi:hypothetical protein D3C73_742310 [compost metagenome]
MTCSPYVRNRAKIESASYPGEKVGTAETVAKNRVPFYATYPLNGDNSEEAFTHFTSNGFEFEWYGSGGWGHGWMRSPVYGIARGKMQYLKGTHCEAYPEVRAYWLEQVDKLLALGIDGIDLRLQNHSNMISDYIHYGYNEPIVAAYQQQYGVDIMLEAADPLSIMRIRGQFYQLFVDEAAKLIHERGKKLQIHFRDSFENPRLSSIYSELGFWAMPKIWPDWERLIELADEVTIKDYNWGSYDSTIAARIKDRAAALHKPLWVHCYIAQGDDLNAAFFDGVAQDDRVTGVLLYEMGHNPYANNVWDGLLEVRPHGEVLMNPVVLGKIQDLMG